MENHVLGKRYSKCMLLAALAVLAVPSAHAGGTMQTCLGWKECFILKYVCIVPPACADGTASTASAAKSIHFEYRLPST